jgi:hypothetical protein
MLLRAEITKQLCLVDKLGGYWMKHGMERISGLATVDEFKTYEPFIARIVLNESKSDEEMLQFINKEYSEPPTPLPVNSSTKVSDFVPTLKRELNELLYTNVQGLVEHFIDPQHIDPIHRKGSNARSEFIDEKRQEKLSDTLQGSMLKYISSFAEHLVNQTTPKIPMSRFWRTQPHTRLEGVDGTRMMVDGAIMSGFKANRKTYHIRDVLVPFKLKKDEQDVTTAVICLSKCVCKVFKAQPTRSFVVGVTVFETSAQIWQFDRSGAIGSEPVDFKSNTPNIEKFLNLMLCFLTCNKTLLGFDPTFIEAQDCPPVIRIKTQNVDQELKIDPKHVFRASGICGRATTCWKAHLSGDKSQQFLIKDSWQPEKHPKEGEMLRIVTEKKVPHVARYHHHEDVCMDGKTVDIKSHIRRGAAFQKCEKLTNKEMPDDPNVKNEFINRVHRRLILKDVGKPIWTVDSPLHLLEALEGCIIGHQALFAAQYLHRDISINNLMVNDQAVDPPYRSFLIDLDMAIHRSENNDDGHTRIGTKVFMSISLLRGVNPHTHVDDLESFFWVLIWICTHYPQDHRNRVTQLTTWNQCMPKELAGIKKEYLTIPHDLTNLFTAQFCDAHLFNCVNSFANLMSNQDIRDWEDQRLYEEILNILQLAQGKLREEETLRKEKMLREEENKSRTGKKRKKAV